MKGEGILLLFKYWQYFSKKGKADIYIIFFKIIYGNRDKYPRLITYCQKRRDRDEWQF